MMRSVLCGVLLLLPGLLAGCATVINGGSGKDPHPIGTRAGQGHHLRCGRRRCLEQRDPLQRGPEARGRLFHQGKIQGGRAAGVPIGRGADRGHRDGLLKEIEYSNSDCTDEQCQLEIGRMLSADRIIVGSIGKAGSRYLLNAKLIEVETAEAVRTSYQIYHSMDELVNGCEGLIGSLLM